MIHGKGEVADYSGLEQTFYLIQRRSDMPSLLN